MKIYLIVILIFLILAIIQFSILPFLTPKGVFPNLILVFCLCLAILFNKQKTLIFALIGALIFFIFSSLDLVFAISVFILLSLAVNLIYQKFFHQFKISRAIFFVLAGMLLYKLIQSYDYFLNWPMLFLEIGYSLIFSLLLFAIFAKLKTNNVFKF